METSDKLSSVSKDSSSKRKKRESLKRKQKQNKTAEDYASMGALTEGMKGLAETAKPLETELATPVLFGTLTKPRPSGQSDTTVHLFQGDSRRLLGEDGEPDPTFKGVLDQQRGQGPIVGVENLPWGKNDKMGDTTMSAIGGSILQSTVHHSGPSDTSVFILDRTQVSGATQSTVRGTWKDGAITRTFPLPDQTFPNASTSAAIFAVRRFDDNQRANYQTAVRNAGKKNEPIIRYLSGTLSSEDMRWATLQKGGEVFSDSNRHQQNHVLSDGGLERSRTASRSKKKTTESGKSEKSTRASKPKLLSFPGQLTSDLPSRVEEERLMKRGEGTLQVMYAEYVETLDAIGTGVPTSEQARKLNRSQTELLQALRSITHRQDGNVVYQPRGTGVTREERLKTSLASKQAVSKEAGERSRGDVDTEITKRMRDAALFHRLFVPSFVSRQLQSLASCDKPTLRDLVSSYELQKGGGIKCPNGEVVGLLQQKL
jgi:hypothetical protein